MDKFCACDAIEKRTKTRSKILAISTGCLLWTVSSLKTFIVRGAQKRSFVLKAGPFVNGNRCRNYCYVLIARSKYLFISLHSSVSQLFMNELSSKFVNVFFIAGIRNQENTFSLTFAKSCARLTSIKTSEGRLSK